MSANLVSLNAMASISFASNSYAYQVETDVADIAHCFMPDHVHQLVKGTRAEADARLYMRKAKQYSGYYFMKRFQVKLWGGKGFDRFVRDAYQYRAAVKYIIENPVKAGLVERVEDYPFTGSSQHTIQELMEIACAT